MSQSVLLKMKKMKKMETAGQELRAVGES